MIQMGGQCFITVGWIERRVASPRAASCGCDTPFPTLSALNLFAKAILQHRVMQILCCKHFMAAKVPPNPGLHPSCGPCPRPVRLPVQPTGVHRQGQARDARCCNALQVRFHPFSVSDTKLHGSSSGSFGLPSLPICTMPSFARSPSSMERGTTQDSIVERGSIALHSRHYLLPRAKLLRFLRNRHHPTPKQKRDRESKPIWMTAPPLNKWLHCPSPLANKCR